MDSAAPSAEPPRDSAALAAFAALVLLPLAAGTAAGRAFPVRAAALRPHLPRLGIASLLLLVAGGD